MFSTEDIAVDVKIGKQTKEKQKSLSNLYTTKWRDQDVILSVCRANKFFGIVLTTAKKSSLTATQCEKSCKAKKWCVQFKIRSKQKKKKKVTPKMKVS